MDEQQAPQKVNHIFWISIRWSTYTAISTIICLACILPVTRWAAGLVLLCYTGYAVSEVFKDYARIQQERQLQGKTAFNFAVINNGLEFVYLVMAVLIGLLCGLGL